jgi:6-phosphogluconolactonase
VDKLNTDRLTMTYPALNHSACVMFLVSGKDKADAFKQALDPAGRVPAAQVCPVDGRLLWLADREAASALPANQQHGS